MLIDGIVRRLIITTKLYRTELEKKSGKVSSIISLMRSYTNMEVIKLATTLCVATFQGHNNQIRYACIKLSFCRMLNAEMFCGEWYSVDLEVVDCSILPRPITIH